MKPKLTYAEFVAAQQKDRRTVAWAINRFITEMNGLDGKPVVKTLGSSHEYTLRRVQRALIGAVLWAELEQEHVIDHKKAKTRLGKLIEFMTTQPRENEQAFRHDYMGIA